MMALQTGQSENKRKYANLAGIAAIFTVIILIIVKTIAWISSGSASVLASLTDSISDAGISIINFCAIRYSLLPADQEHRFGHGKIEGLAALFQGSFIAGAAVFLVLESLSRYAYAHPVENYNFGIAVMIFSIMASFILVLIQRHSLKHAPSLAIEADKAHFSSDIILNFGVIITLLILGNGGPQWIDPAFAVCVSLYLFYIAKTISSKGVDMLLDRELSDEVREQIYNVIVNERGVLGVHDLRTRKSGMRAFISFDIEADPGLSLQSAHEIARRVEKKILEKIPDSEIMIHVDPHGDTEDGRHQIPGVHH
jgi:ferrous-iron efflux pump FieF